jgi:hypothetical protein
LSCHDFDDNQVRPQLFVLVYNLGNVLRRFALEGLATALGPRSRWQPKATLGGTRRFIISLRTGCGRIM